MAAAPGAHASAIYNLTGSTSGFGDVVGPYLLARQTARREAPVYLVVDDRAESVLRTFLEQPAPVPLVLPPGMAIARPADVPRLPSIEHVYETFHGARDSGGTAVDVVSLLAHPPTAILSTNDLHSPYGRDYFPAEFTSTGLGEVHAGDTTLYFSAAGLGSDRHGILIDESVAPYEGKSDAERRAIATRAFPEGSPLRELLERRLHAGADLAFGYGIHNEVAVHGAWRPYPGQFRSYVQGLEGAARESGKPIVFLTPNRPEMLAAALAGSLPADRVRILSLEELAKAPALRRGEIALVSTGSLGSRQFLALTAASDLPYLIEGDSALSAAVHLGKPFVMLKGPWGLFGIDGLGRALRESGARWAGRTYPERHAPGDDTPNFADLAEIRRDAAAFRRLREQANDWSASLHDLVALAEGRGDAAEILARRKDPVLLFSWAKGQLRHGRIDRAGFDRLTAGIADAASIEARITAKIRLAGSEPGRPCSPRFGALRKWAGTAQ